MFKMPATTFIYFIDVKFLHNYFLSFMVGKHFIPQNALMYPDALKKRAK